MIYKKNQTEKISVLKADSSQSISIKITDNTIMNETIRTLYVDFDKEPEQASIKIIGMNTLPVLYSLFIFFSKIFVSIAIISLKTKPVSQYYFN